MEKRIKIERDFTDGGDEIVLHEEFFTRKGKKFLRRWIGDKDTLPTLGLKWYELTSKFIAGLPKDRQSEVQVIADLL